MKERIILLVILSNKFFQLRLDVEYAFGWEFEFNQWHTSFFEVFQESDFRWLKEHETSTFAVRSPCCSSYTMNVVAGVVGGIELHYPVHRWNIQPACGNVGADQGALFGITIECERENRLLK